MNGNIHLMSGLSLWTVNFRRLATKCLTLIRNDPRSRKRSVSNSQKPTESPCLDSLLTLLTQRTLLTFVAHFSLPQIPGFLCWGTKCKILSIPLQYRLSKLRDGLLRDLSPPVWQRSNSCAKRCAVGTCFHFSVSAHLAQSPNSLHRCQQVLITAEALLLQKGDFCFNIFFRVLWIPYMCDGTWNYFKCRSSLSWFSLFVPVSCFF